MTTPDPQQWNTANRGWNHLTQVLGIWIPARLRITRRAGLALRKLRTGK